MNREYEFCKSCLRSRLQVCKIVEYGRTLQLVCPNCGTYAYMPAWGKKVDRYGDQPLSEVAKRTVLGYALKRIRTQKRRR